MNTLRQRACQICGNSDIRPLFDNEMAPLAGVDLSYRVGACSTCGFNFAFELPDDATYQRYYQNLSKYDVSATLSASDQKRFDAIVRLCQCWLTPQSTIVDIGCGEGALLSKLKILGFQNLFGVDPAPNAPTIALDKYGLEAVRQGFFDNAASVVPMTSADGVCIAAVLEHLPNLRADMQILISNMKPGGKLFIEVPTLELFGVENSEPFGEFSLEHINYFCSESLGQLMASLGWRCEHTEYVEYPELQTGSVISVFARKDSPVAADFSALPPQLDDYITGCEQQVRAVLERIPTGDIIIYGAGSHSARVLPLLAKTTGLNVVAVVDGNPNLLGKTLGQWTIQAPGLICSLPQKVPIVISSYRAQKEIAASLRGTYPNPLVLLY